MRASLPLACLLPVVALLAACASTEGTGGFDPLFGADDAADVPTEDQGEAAVDWEALAPLRIDVFPSGMDDAAADLRPHTFTVELDPFEATALRLRPAVTVSGRIRATDVSPWSSDLPGDEVDVADARLVFRRGPGVQNTFARTDAFGRFTAQVVPSDEPYTLSIAPDTPDLPLTSLPIDITSDRSTLVADLDLGEGTLIYGTVTQGVDDPLPISGATVWVEDASGAISENTTTDAQGFYALRVAGGGPYYVRTGGRRPTDATLTRTIDTVGTRGAHCDFAYPGAPRVSLAGTVINGATGNPAHRATVTVRSVELTDYLAAADRLGQDASATPDAIVPPSGFFVTTVPRGLHELAIVPPEGSDVSPLLTPLDVDSAVELGTLTLQPLEVHTGQVIDADGEPVPDVAVGCEEIGFGERAWSATSDADGRFLLDLPAVPVSCTFTPAAARSATAARPLAGTRRTFTPDGELIGVQLRPGAPVELDLTWVSPDGSLNALAYALVEIRNARGDLLAVTTSDEGGTVSTRIDPELAD